MGQLVAPAMSLRMQPQKGAAPEFRYSHGLSGHLAGPSRANQEAPDKSQQPPPTPNQEKQSCRHYTVTVTEFRGYTPGSRNTPFFCRVVKDPPKIHRGNGVCPSQTIGRGLHDSRVWVGTTGDVLTIPFDNPFHSTFKECSPQRLWLSRPHPLEDAAPEFKHSIHTKQRPQFGSSAILVHNFPSGA